MTANQVQRIDEPDLAIFRKRPKRSVPVGLVGERTVAVNEYGADGGSGSPNRCGAERRGLDFKALGQVTVESPATDRDDEIRCDKPRLPPTRVSGFDLWELTGPRWTRTV